MSTATNLTQKEAQDHRVSVHDPNETQPHTIVIGSGPAGIRFAQELLKRQPYARVTVFGNEPYRPYNRVQLSSLLAGEIDYESIHTPLPDLQAHPGFSVEIKTIKSIDKDKHCVIDHDGVEHHYHHLVIATGARPHTPNIPGFEQQGVFTFRSLKDTEFLFSRINRARHVVVVGGGLLGVEAARALLKYNTQVTLIQQGQRLMNRQLDEFASEKLKQKVEALGIKVIVQSGVREILGDGRVTGVVTRDKITVECDTVLICAGIKPNKEIARNAGISVSNGITIDDQLRTSVNNIYAIGECSEHRGQTYGLVNPGYEQAAICADIISGGSAHYIGSLSVSRLKVVGEQVCSMGEVTDLVERPKLNEIRFSRKRKNTYRKIVVHKGILIGAIAYGEWEEQQRIQETYQNQRRVWPWQQFWFWLTGNLFFNPSAKNNVHEWPLESVICQCNNITHGDIVTSIAAGNTTPAQIQKTTTASTVCGSCKPLVQALCNDIGPIEKEKAWLPSLLGSAIALCAAFAVLFIPGLATSDSVQTVNAFEPIWTDKFNKQVSGFTLLGLSVLGLVISLKKHILKKHLGNFSYWRLVHIFIGVFCASTLVLHTGLHLGENLNQMLMINFLGILIFGALAGTTVSLSHFFSATHAIQLRRFWSWAHILIAWPLPILLGAHIITVYYF